MEESMLRELIIIQNALPEMIPTDLWEEWAQANEKVCDYFEKVELKTGKTFNKQIQKYIENLKDLVEDYIEEEPKQKKKEKLPTITP